MSTFRRLPARRVDEKRELPGGRLVRRRMVGGGGAQPMAVNDLEPADLLEELGVEAHDPAMGFEELDVVGEVRLVAALCAGGGSAAPISSLSNPKTEQKVATRFRPRASASQ